MNTEFNKLEKVDLRKLWNGEASDFTPWLAQEENIAELGETIGMECKYPNLAYFTNSFHYFSCIIVLLLIFNDAI